MIAIIAAVGVAATRRPVAPPAAPPQPPPAFPILAAGTRLADRIELVHGATTLWLERRGQVWGLAQAGGYPVRPAASAALLDGLLALKLGEPVAGSPESLGLADPSDPTGAGTLVRVLALSGQALAAIIVGPEPGVVRRPGLPQAWRATPPLQVSTNAQAWLDTQVPMPNLTQVTLPGGSATETAALRRVLDGLQFTQVRAGPQIRPPLERSIQMELPDGTATLNLGRLAGAEWLKVTGSSAWAHTLAPYAFALAPGSATP